MLYLWGKLSIIILICSARLEEKGYFEYGGSTIVMFFPPNIMIDEDILRQSQAGYETQVFIGDKIGQRKE